MLGVNTGCEGISPICARPSSHILGTDEERSLEQRDLPAFPEVSLGIPVGNAEKFHGNIYRGLGEVGADGTRGSVYIKLHFSTAVPVVWCPAGTCPEPQKQK